MAGLLGLASPVRLSNLLIAIAIGATAGRSAASALRNADADGVRHDARQVGVRTARSNAALAGKRNSPLFPPQPGVHGSGGSYAYVLFPLATLFAWKKSYDEFRLNGRTYWDKQSKTRVIGAVLPMWHLSAGAALTIAAFGMVLMSLTAGRADKTAAARVGAESQAAGPIQPTPPSADAAAPAVATSAIADANSGQIGAIQKWRRGVPGR